jgi:WD40 repeat protein
MYGVSITNLIESEEMKNKFSQFVCKKCNKIPFDPFAVDHESGHIYLCDECLRSSLTNNESSIITKAFYNNKINSIKSLHSVVFKNTEFHCPFNEKGCKERMNLEEIKSHLDNCKFYKKLDIIRKVISSNEEHKDKENKSYPVLNENSVFTEKIYSRFENQFQEMYKNLYMKVSKLEKKIEHIIENQSIFQEEFKFLSRKTSICTICSQRGKREFCGLCDFQFCRKCIIKCKICDKNVCLLCIKKNKGCKNSCKNFLCERCFSTHFTENKQFTNSKVEEFFFRSKICDRNKCLECDVTILCQNCNNKCCSDCFKDCSLSIKNLCNKCYGKNKGNIGKIIDKFFPSEDSLDSINNTRSILIGTNNGELKHFNLENFSLINKFFIHKDTIKCLRKVEDKVVSCSSDGYLKVWESMNFTNSVFEYCDKQDKNMYNEISDSLWMSNHSIISSCINNNYCLLFNIKKKNIERRLPISTPTTLCRISESSVLVGTEWSKILNWDVNSDKINFELNAHNGTSVNNIIKLFHYNQSSFLSSGDDNNFKLWDINTLENILVLGNEQCNSNVLEMNDGRIVNGCHDSSVKIRDLNSKEICVLKGHKDRVCDFLAFNEYYLLSCSFDHSLRLWDLRKNDIVYFHQFSNPLIKLMEVNM